MTHGNSDEEWERAVAEEEALSRSMVVVRPDSKLVRMAEAALAEVARYTDMKGEVAKAEIELKRDIANAEVGLRAKAVGVGRLAVALLAAIVMLALAGYIGLRGMGIESKELMDFAKSAGLLITVMFAGKGIGDMVSGWKDKG